MIFLDTNIVIWAFRGETHLLSGKVIHAIENNDLYISPMVKLELQYLYEIKRVKMTPQIVLDFLYKAIGLVVHDLSFDKMITTSLDVRWTRDPFDRIITSHAQTLDSVLLTKDEVIRAHYKKAVW